MAVSPILLFAFLASSAPAWRTYEVYQPHIAHSTVVDGDCDDLRYNHCAAIARFKGQWFCLWNANTSPIEGRPGQRIVMSASSDGRKWDPPERAFDNPKRSVNPVPCANGVQWQPNLIAIGRELWAFWSQLSKGAGYGCWFSRLSDPGGRWVNRRLLWNDAPDPVVDGTAWRVLPLSGPVRLRSNRILVPVALVGPRAADAPENLRGWPAREKRGSVLYSDDSGRTFSVSAGTLLPGFSWAQWEPTVWEPVPGTVVMLARNNAGKAPTEALLQFVSHDGGVTWTPHRPVPLCTAASRMQVVRFGTRRMLVHNDWSGGPGFERRYNLALFFTRGTGVDFVAGPGFSGTDPAAAYPSICIADRECMIAYSRGYPPRAIRVARVAPLPAPDRYYLFPRTNLPPPLAPYRAGLFWRFAGRQYVTTREPVKLLGNESFTVCAWVIGAQGVLLDTRTAVPPGGFVVALKANRPVISLPIADHELTTRLSLRWHEWNYLGISVDVSKSRAEFSVNDLSETVRFAPHLPGSLRCGRGRLGAKILEHSMLPSLRGAIRALAVYPGALNRAELHAVRNRFAAAIRQPTIQPAETPNVSPLLVFDPAEPAALRTTFAIPEDTRLGAEVLSEQGRPVLCLPDTVSAGVDLDANDRMRGDEVDIVFHFRTATAGRTVVCTIGDANTPARVIAEEKRLFLRCGNETQAIGPLEPNPWNRIEIRTWKNVTVVRLREEPEARARHSPQATWVYLGDGYPGRRTSLKNARLFVDVHSVRTRVLRGVHPGETP